MAKQNYIWVKMTKEWGGFGVDEVVRFGESKGVERIDKGFGVKVPEPASSKKAAAADKAKAAKDAKAAEKAKAEADEKAAEEAKAAEAAAVGEKAKADAAARVAAEKAKAENADNRP